MVHVDISSTPRIVREENLIASVVPSAAHEAICAIIGKSDVPMTGAESQSVESTTVPDNSNCNDVTLLNSCSNADTVSVPVLETEKTDSAPLPVTNTDSKPAATPESATTSTPAKGPTLADVLRSQEKIRKDKKKANSAFRVEIPKPSAANLREIEHLFADGRPSWDILSAKLASARPFKLPCARFFMVLETGQELARVDNAKILQSFVRDNANPVVEELLESHDIGQLAKIPGGNLRVYVTSEENCQKLTDQEVTILGNKYSFREFDLLGSKYFLDVFGVSPGMECGRIARALHDLGCDIIYENFREAIAGKAITMSTWRVYFRSTSCPPALYVNGKVCEQLDIEGRLFLARGKSSPLPTERLRFGQRSNYCLGCSPKQTKANSGHKASIRQPAKPATAPKPAVVDIKTSTVPKNQVKSQSKRKNSIESSSNEVTKSPAISTKQVNNEVPMGSTNDSDEISVDGLGTPEFTPPGSPIPTSTSPLQPAQTHHWMTARSRNKRNRKVNEFPNLISRARPAPLDGLATNNYFDVLRSVEVKYEKVDVTTNAEYGKRYQIIPAEVTINDAILSSKESAHFFKKRHTNIVKGDRPARIGEVVQLMKDDVKHAHSSIRPDKLVQADSYIRTAEKIISQASNADKVTQFASTHPIALHGALLRAMKSNCSDINNLVQLHTINRVLVASEPSTDTAFTTKWAKVIGGKVPSNRNELFAKVNSWWTATPENAQLITATKALAFFELMLLSTAPMIYKNDHWIQYITGEPAIWIPAHHCRLLHPNTLLLLLRSYVGTLCLSEWFDLGWTNEIYDHLEELQLSENVYFDEASVLQLRSENDMVQLIAGPINVQY